MTVWLLTVWLMLADREKVWLELTYDTEAECRQWLEFYREYPFKPVCTLVENREKS